MNRSASEWAFEKFIEEISVPASSTTNTASSKAEDGVVEIQKPHNHSDLNLTAQIASEDVHAFLKSRLDLACAAAAISRVASVKPIGEDFCSIAELQHGIGGEKDVQLRSQPSDSDHGTSFPRNEAGGSSVVLPAVPDVPKKQERQAKQTTSGSSREDSDDDDIEGETGTNAELSDAKRARRMMSNRESARRSRRRKQQQLSELETQVGQLRDERTSLLSRHTDFNKKCEDASVDNRILKADIETLRTKVKMAEEQVKRVTGINPMLISRSNMSGMAMQFVGGQMNTHTNIGISLSPSGDHLSRQHVPGINPAAPDLHRLTGSYPSNINMVPNDTNLPTENAANTICEIEHVSSAGSIGDPPCMQNHVGCAVSPSRLFPAHDSGASHIIAQHNKKKK